MQPVAECTKVLVHLFVHDRAHVRASLSLVAQEEKQRQQEDKEGEAQHDKEGEAQHELSKQQQQQQQQQQPPFISFRLEDTIIMVPSALAAEWRSEDSGGGGTSSGDSEPEPEPPPAILDTLTYWLQGTSWKAPKLILLKPVSEEAAQQALIAIAPLLEAKISLHAPLDGGKMVQFLHGPQEHSVFLRFASALGVIPLSQAEGCPLIAQQLGMNTFDNWWALAVHQRHDASQPPPS